MVIDTVFGLNSAAREPKTAAPNFLVRIGAAVSLQFARMWCGMHGHLILMHFAPNKLSLQCALCGYESEGWEVGRPLVARRAGDTRRPHAHVNQSRPERRVALRAMPGTARMAS